MQVLRCANALLAADPASAQRRLRARTFGVIPLGPRTGLIKWGGAHLLAVCRLPGLAVPLGRRRR